MKRLLISTSIITGLLSLNTYGAEKHVHGEAELFIAIEGASVLIDFESPADNIIGFEHPPRNEKQKTTLESSEQLLQSYTNLIELVDGSCTQTDSSIKIPFDSHDDHKGHSDEHHDDHKDHSDEHHDDHKGHSDEHHSDHKDHSDEHHDNHKGHSDEHHSDHKGHSDEHHDSHGENIHSDFNASYTLSCSGAEIKSLQVNALKAFPRIEKLQVNWVNNESQGSQNITRENTLISF